MLNSSTTSVPIRNFGPELLLSTTRLYALAHSNSTTLTERAGKR
jgi:hypothetical protein